MKNKLKNIILVAFIFIIVNAAPSYADVYFNWDGNKVTQYDGDTSVLPTGEKTSRDVKYGNPRGSIISTAIIDISDENKGNVAMHIQTLAHVECDKIIHAATLQRFDKGTNDWERVIRFEYEALKEDNPDEKLTSLSHGVLVEDLPAGTYRASGLHAVYLGDDYESFSTRTNGIQINRW